MTRLGLTSLLPAAVAVVGATAVATWLVHAAAAERIRKGRRP